MLRYLISIGIFITSASTVLALQETTLTIESNHVAADWIFYVLIFVILLLGISRVFFAKSFRDGMQSFRNFNMAHQNFKTQNLKLFFVDISMVVIFILLFTLLIFHSMDQSQGWKQEDEFKWYVVLCLLAILALGLKLFANKILTEILPFKENLHFSNYLFWSGIKMYGLVLLPIVLFVIYNPFISLHAWTLPILVAGSFLFYLIYVLRLFKLGKDYIYKSNLHFFLYICAFEIAPLFVILKFSFLIINKLQQVFV